MALTCMSPPSLYFGSFLDIPAVTGIQSTAGSSSVTGRPSSRGPSVWR
jgi:hypothetical protein